MSNVRSLTNPSPENALGNIVSLSSPRFEKSMQHETPHLLDLQTVDFMARSETIKELFTLPYNENEALFALHRMENVLIIEPMMHLLGLDDDGGASSDDEKSLHSTLNATKQLLSIIDEIDSNAPYLSYDKNVCDSTLIPEGVTTLAAVSSQEETLPTDLSVAISTGCMFPGLKVLEDNEISLSESAMSERNQQPDMLTEMQRGPLLTAGSPFLPPPTHFMPPGGDYASSDRLHHAYSGSERNKSRVSNELVPTDRNIRVVDLHDMKLAVSNDNVVYRTAEHPGFIVRALDVAEELDMDGCLDLYLDSVIANVPELALALHAKGYIRGIRFIRSQQVAFLSASSTLGQHPGFVSGKSPTSGFTRYSQSELVNSLVLASRDRNAAEFNPGWNEAEPPMMFDPKTIDFDAAAIMNFLKLHCNQENGTYILRRAPGSNGLRIIELDEQCAAKKQKFMWMLAMLSYRFALTLNDKVPSVTLLARRMIRRRQTSLFNTCNSMLDQIKELGGDDHGTIQSAVFEHLADGHLARVDEHRSRSNPRQSAHSAKQTTDGGADTQAEQDSSNCSSGGGYDEEDCDEQTELLDATNLLLQAADRLKSVIHKEIKSTLAETEDDEQSNDRHQQFPTLDEDDCASDAVIESLTLQIAGILHKLIQASLSLIISCLRNSQIANCVKYLFRLVEPCKLWVLLRHHVAKRRTKSTSTAEQQHLQASSASSSTKTSATRGSKSTGKEAAALPASRRNKSILQRHAGCSLQYFPTRLAQQQRQAPNASDASSPFWGADMTIIGSLPLLWNLLGETCREILKQTAGMSLEDAQLKSKLEELLATFYCLDHSVSSSCDNLEDLISRYKLTLFPTPDNSSNPTAANDERKVHKSKSKAKVKAKKQRQAQFDSELQNDWVMIFGNAALYNANSSFISPLSIPIVFPNQTSVDTRWPVNRPLHAMFVLHAIVAPVVLFDRPLKLPHWLLVPNTTELGCSQLYCPHLNQDAFDAYLTYDNDLKLQLALIYCFMCTTMLNNDKTLRKVISSQSGPNASQKACLRAGGNKAASIDPVSSAGLMISDSFVREAIRRLADSCNVLGQKLFSSALHLIHTHKLCVGDCAPTSARDDPRVLIRLAEEIFQAGIVLFEAAGDSVNAVTVRCNYSSLLRLQATWLVQGESLDANNMLSLSESGIRFEYLDIAVEQLLLVINNCDQSHRMLGNRTPKNCGVWDTVCLELGMALLTVGIFNKFKCSPLHRLEESSQPTGARSGISLNHMKELIVGPLERALVCLHDVRNDKIAAAANYYLGSYYSTTWATHKHSDDVSSALEKALLHYNDAFQYYSRYDVGPTLVHILLDMCDLYMASYSASEQQLIELNLARRAVATTSDGIASQQMSADGSTRDMQPASSSASSWAPSAASELVVALVGGALQSLLECRFAFTTTSVARYRTKMTDLATLVSVRLSTVLLKLIQAQGREQLFPIKLMPTVIGADQLHGASSDERTDYLKELKDIYALLLRVAKSGGAAIKLQPQSLPSTPRSPAIMPVLQSSASRVVGMATSADSEETAEACVVVYDVLWRLHRHPYIKRAFANQSQVSTDSQQSTSSENSSRSDAVPSANSEISEEAS